jgi:hypothetical protein
MTMSGNTGGHPVAERDGREKLTAMSIVFWASREGLPEPSEVSTTWSADGVELVMNFRCGDQRCRATEIVGSYEIVRL